MLEIRKEKGERRTDNGGRRTENGERRKGIKAIEAFYDNVIANGDLIFEIKESIPCGDECANFAHITNKINGAEIKTKMIVI